MTIDSVVQKTGLTLGVVVALRGSATWVITPDDHQRARDAAPSTSSRCSARSAASRLAMVNSFKKVVSPALVLAYAAFEGVFVGAFSKVIESASHRREPGGLVIGAVVGTFAAVAGTLAAYKFFNIKVGTRFRKWVIGAMLGFVAVSLLDFVLSFFGAGFGFNGFGAMGLSRASSASGSAC